MNKLTIVGLIFLMNCNLNSRSQQRDKNAILSYKISVDTFMADKSIPQLAKDLYLGKLKPTDDEANLVLIDSINSKEQARVFYFLVITKIMGFADGSYSESLGGAAKEFIENNTIEFLSYFKNNKDLLTDKDFANWARMVYGEIQIEDEGSEQKAVKDIETKMITNCQGFSTDYKDNIVKFIGLMN
jgi:hypothetical protein